MNDTPLAPPDPVQSPGERRQVTVLFEDMVGFTAISERLGEEGTYSLIQPINTLDLMQARALLGQLHA